MSTNQKSCQAGGVAVMMPYGAFELKQNYQKNMLMGSISSALLATICIFALWIFSFSTYEVIVEPIGDNGLGELDGWRLPPPIKPWRPVVKPNKPGGAPSKRGKLVFIDDDEFIEDTNVTVTEGGFLVSDWDSASSGEYEDGGRGIPYNPGYLPPPDKFISVEVQPVQIYEESPAYPRLALEGGFSAYVVVEAFINNNGIVVKAQAKKCNRPGIGFEESAVAAALKGRYRPAIQNGEPIGIWISYRVNFEIGN